MQGSTQAVVVLVTAAAFVTCPGLGRGAETSPPAGSQPAPIVAFTEPAMDPMVRALLVGLIASLLREAAASPDPVNALGEALERKLRLALSSPEFVQRAESLIGQAVKDAPPELREPLVQFALAMLNNLRREMLNGARAHARQ